MPSKPRPGVKGVYVELPLGLLALLGRRANQDRRTMKATLVLAVEQYLGVTPDDYQREPEQVLLLSPATQAPTPAVTENVAGEKGHRPSRKKAAKNLRDKRTTGKGKQRDGP
jgi:hypothetical protein